MAEILIIGGGVAGLSAGIYAQLNGHHATVCERHFVAGGNLTGWKRGDYHIDNCIHWLTGTNPNTDTYKMWEDLGVLGNVDVFQPDRLFTCVLDGQTLSLSYDLAKFENDMLALSPEDEKEIRSLIRAIDVVQALMGIAGKDHNEKASFAKLVCAAPALLKYYRITAGELGKRFKHPLLRFFFTSLWGEKFGAISQIFVFATFCGGNGGIPKGGSCAMADRMVERFESLGGTLLLKKEAVKVDLNGNRAESVTFSDGSTIKADYVILTGDPASEFEKLIDVPMPSALKKKYDDPRLARFSSYHCAFSCDLSELPFKGDRFYEIPKEYQKVLKSKSLALREFSHEKDFAPKGKNIIQTMIYLYEDDAKEFIELRKQDRAAYNEKKRELSEIIKKIIEKHIPRFEGKLTCIDVWTPATYRRYTDTQIGSWMSFVMPAKLLPVKCENAVGELTNVLLATQWQQLPGGLPIAAECGKLAIETVVKKERALSR